MALITRENSNITRWMAKAPTTGLMVGSMKANGQKEKCMEEEVIPGPTGRNIKETIGKIIKRERESSNGLMEKDMKVIGKMENMRDLVKFYKGRL